ncbi:uncharacterized protein BDW70DRAFT_91276 [Aspergillus foveolatus]|uniref:uncharacterized protein n=1 Tax=Aspergillus foveolatus TaxID=210207 RepID=UPI003CCCDB4F
MSHKTQIPIAHIWVRCFLTLAPIDRLAGCLVLVLRPLDINNWFPRYFLESRLFFFPFRCFFFLSLSFFFACHRLRLAWFARQWPIVELTWLIGNSRGQMLMHQSFCRSLVGMGPLGFSG